MKFQPTAANSHSSIHKTFFKSAITSNCRVKRHLISTSSHEHGQPAETKPDSTMFTQGVKMGCIQEDLKLYK